MNEHKDAQAGIPPWLQVNHETKEETERSQEPHTKTSSQHPQSFDGARRTAHSPNPPAPQQPPASYSRPEPQLAPPQKPWFDAPKVTEQPPAPQPTPPETPPPTPRPDQSISQPVTRQPAAPQNPPSQPPFGRTSSEVQERPLKAEASMPPKNQPSAPGWAPTQPPAPGMSSSPQNPEQPPHVELTPPVALDQRNLVNPVKAPPKAGWRKLVHNLTGGKINPGDSRSAMEEDALLAAVRTPLRGDYRIAVMSLKGGVGKTTTTVALGGVFASERGDRVIAIDANPDLGTLAQRTAAPGPATIRDLLTAEDTSRYPQVRAFTTQAASRLEVIGSERDPAVSEAFSEDDYRHAIDILQHHYNVILTDCGTGLMHSAMGGVLELANTLVLVTSSALDGAQSASATLDWLVMHGYEQLAANSIVVVSSSAPGKPTVDIDQIVEHFRSRTRAVHVIPYDRHLAEGAVVDLNRMARPTLTAYRQLAASIAEDFGSWHRHAR